MAKPQLENGYTMLPNEIIDHFRLLNLSSNDWRLLWVIIRLTYGYRRRVCKISNVHIARLTNLHRVVVSRSLKKLEKQNVIHRNGKTIGLQEDWERWVGPEQKLTELLPSEGESQNLTIKVSKNANKKIAELLPPINEIVTFQTGLKENSKDNNKDNSPRKRGDPRIREVLDIIEKKTGQPIPFYAKEGAAVKRALSMGFTQEQIVGCWETMKSFYFWQGKWLPLAKVTENLGEFASGRLREGSKSRRVDASRPTSDFTGSW